MFYQLNSKSLESEGVASHRDLWNKVKENAKGFSMTVDTEFKAIEGFENRFRVIMSTGIKDRHGEIVFQNWELDNFKKNPVFLDSHNYSSIEHILGRVLDVSAETGRLMGDVEFATENPKGYLAMRLAMGGFLNATSVGFIPLEFDQDGNITKAELLEDSAVSVPANAEALFERNVKSYEEADTIIDEVTEEDSQESDGESKPEDPTADTERASTEDEGQASAPESKTEGKSIEVKSKTPDTYKILVTKLQIQSSVMKAVAKQLQETKPQTLAERKRKILRDIRRVL